MFTGCVNSHLMYMKSSNSWNSNLPGYRAYFPHTAKNCGINKQHQSDFRQAMISNDCCNVCKPREGEETYKPTLFVKWWWSTGSLTSIYYLPQETNLGLRSALTLDFRVYKLFKYFPKKSNTKNNLRIRNETFPQKKNPTNIYYYFYFKIFYLIFIF